MFHALPRKEQLPTLWRIEKAQNASCTWSCRILTGRCASQMSQPLEYHKMGTSRNLEPWKYVEIVWTRNPPNPTNPTRVDSIMLYYAIIFWYSLPAPACLPNVSCMYGFVSNTFILFDQLPSLWSAQPGTIRDGFSRSSTLTPWILVPTSNLDTRWYRILKVFPWFLLQKWMNMCNMRVGRSPCSSPETSGNIWTPSHLATGGQFPKVISWVHGDDFWWVGLQWPRSLGCDVAEGFMTQNHHDIVGIGTKEQRQDVKVQSVHESKFRTSPQNTLT